MVDNYFVCVSKLEEVGVLQVNKKLKQRKIMFTISNNILCIAYSAYASMIARLDVGSTILVEGTLKFVVSKDNNVDLLPVINVSHIESYSVQDAICIDKFKKKIKIPKTKF